LVRVRLPCAAPVVERHGRFVAQQKEGRRVSVAGGPMITVSRSARALTWSLLGGAVLASAIAAAQTPRGTPPIGAAPAGATATLAPTRAPIFVNTAAPAVTPSPVIAPVTPAVASTSGTAVVTSSGALASDTPPEP